MKFTLLPEGRLTPRTITIHMAIIAALMGAILMVAAWSEQSRMDKIREAVRQCRVDQNACIGGFVVWHGGLIELIDDCSGCRPQSIDVVRVKNLLSHSNELGRVHHIVPHGGDEWANTLEVYARQIVRSGKH